MPGVKRAPRTRRRTYLREWRKYRDMTLEGVAKTMGWEHSSLQRLETGKTPYNQDHLEILAEIYRCEPMDLISRDPAWGEPTDELARQVMAAPIDVRQQAKAILDGLMKTRR